MAALGVALVGAQASGGEPQALATRKEKMSHTVGVDTGRNLRQLTTEVDLDLLIKGIKDGLSGEAPLMTETELWETRNATQLEMRQLFIPSQLAYGEKGAGRVVGPNATLVFDLEPISIE